MWRATFERAALPVAHQLTDFSCIIIQLEPFDTAEKRGPPRDASLEQRLPKTRGTRNDRRFDL